MMLKCLGYSIYVNSWEEFVSLFHKKIDLWTFEMFIIWLRRLKMKQYKQ